MKFLKFLVFTLFICVLTGCGEKGTENIESEIIDEESTNEMADVEPPEFTNIPEQVIVDPGFNKDKQGEFERLIESKEIKAIDKIDGEVTVDVDDSDIDYENPGEYVLKLIAKDKAGNINEEKIKLMVNDYQVYIAYQEAVNLDKEKLNESDLGTYSYGDINIAQEEIEWLEDGAIYRSIAKQLEGFYVFGEEYYEGWGQDVVPLVFGIEKLKTWDEMSSYVDNAILYISKKDPIGEIMARFESLTNTDGTFDYIEGKFNFKLSDLTEVAQNMNITENMLGYILAYIEEYRPKTDFDGNSYTCELSIYGRKEDRNILVKEDFEAISEDNDINIKDDFKQSGNDFFYYAYSPTGDICKGDIIITNRGIRLGASYNNVTYVYGYGKLGEIDLNSDLIYEVLNAYQSDHSSLFSEQCFKYMAYKNNDEDGEIVFFFDEADKVSWIVYINSVQYSL